MGCACMIYKGSRWQWNVKGDSVRRGPSLNARACGHGSDDMTRVDPQRRHYDKHYDNELPPSLYAVLPALFSPELSSLPN